MQCSGIDNKAFQNLKVYQSYECKFAVADIKSFKYRFTSYDRLKACNFLQVFFIKELVNSGC